mgnify:CR=1 FL=1
MLPLIRNRIFSLLAFQCYNFTSLLAFGVVILMFSSCTSIGKKTSQSVLPYQMAPKSVSKPVARVSPTTSIALQANDLKTGSYGSLASTVSQATTHSGAYGAEITKMLGNRFDIYNNGVNTLIIRQKDRLNASVPPLFEEAIALGKIRSLHKSANLPDVRMSYSKGRVTFLFPEDLQVQQSVSLIRNTLRVQGVVEAVAVFVSTPK